MCLKAVVTEFGVGATRLSLTITPSATTHILPSIFKSITKRRDRVLKMMMKARGFPSGAYERRKQHLVSSLDSIPEDSSKVSFSDGRDFSYFDQLSVINQDRRRYSRQPFSPSPFLTEAAQRHATAMAFSSKVFHSVDTIEDLMLDLSSNNVAENIQRGDNLKAMHQETMNGPTESINRLNLLSRCFNEFGVGVARGVDGKLYMCQLFRRS